ncbi:MAG: GNAT family N-acetyltransferase [Defluviitaleaceae bacterium]|nr:GNAT family N-acetyltransferase [Defluviitaleaceae bacterium]
MILLQEIDEDNWLDCIELEHENRRFVESAVFNLADAYVSRHYMTAYGIYNECTIVGMVLVRNEPANYTKNYAFTEFFIADNYLRKGYGRKAVAALLAMLKNEKGFDVARICVDEENYIALKFFKKCGFIEESGACWDSRYIDFSIRL